MPRLPGASWAAAALIAEGSDASDEAGCAFVPAPSEARLFAVPLAAVEDVLAELDDEESIDVTVWLIEISCSRLLTLTNWLTYSLGSEVAVGSWFFNSVTNRVRKSLAEMVAALSLELLVLFDSEAIGVAVFAATVCAAVSW
jgi:hypothetical protein